MSYTIDDMMKALTAPRKFKALKKTKVMTLGELEKMDEEGWELVQILEPNEQRAYPRYLFRAKPRWPPVEPA